MNNLIKEAQKENLQLEVLLFNTESTNIDIINDTVDKFVINRNKIYKIKAIIHGKTVKINTDNINNPKEIIKLLKEIAETIDNFDINTIATNSDLPLIKLNRKKNNYNKIIEELKSLYNLKNEYSNLFSIDTSFNYFFGKITLKNTNNITLEDKYSYIKINEEIVLKNNDKNESDWFTLINKNYNFNKLKNKIENKIKDMNIKFNRTSCETKKYNVLITNSAVSSILDSIVPIFYAKNINKKLSVLSDKINNKIFSDKLNIVEDPCNSNFFKKRLFDNEGTKTYYKEIVKNGKFITKLYNNKEAIKDKTKSTGNNYGVNGLYIKPGKISPEEMINKEKNCILIDGFSGLHVGIDTVNGNVSLQSFGYLIKDGKKINGLEMVILSTNIFELFSNIKEMGNDLEFFNSSTGAPSILFENITLTGNK